MSFSASAVAKLLFAFHGPFGTVSVKKVPRRVAPVAAPEEPTKRWVVRYGPLAFLPSRPHTWQAIGCGVVTDRAKARIWHSKPEAQRFADFNGGEVEEL